MPGPHGSSRRPCPAELDVSSSSRRRRKALQEPVRRESRKKGRKLSGFFIYVRVLHGLCHSCDERVPQIVPDGIHVSEAIKEPGKV